MKRTRASARAQALGWGEGGAEVAQERGGVVEGGAEGEAEEERQLALKTAGTIRQQAMTITRASLEVSTLGLVTSSWTETWFLMAQLPMHRLPGARNQISPIYPISRSFSGSRHLDAVCGQDGAEVPLLLSRIVNQVAHQNQAPGLLWNAYIQQPPRYPTDRRY